MARATWKIVDRGEVPEQAPSIVFACPGCGHDAELPVIGLPIAQVGGGLVFDSAPHATPLTIQCRRCRRTFSGA
jgi:hypothetical protein